ncbi:hypothetical protein L1887_20692 [Cichorium endivia]|nr:hypothetical protein L1887_20692 [Cichorium endivia]
MFTYSQPAFSVFSELLTVFSFLYYHKCYLVVINDMVVSGFWTVVAAKSRSASVIAAELRFSASGVVGESAESSMSYMDCISDVGHDSNLAMPDYFDCGDPVHICSLFIYN